MLKVKLLDCVSIGAESFGLPVFNNEPHKPRKTEADPSKVNHKALDDICKLSDLPWWAVQVRSYPPPRLCAAEEETLPNATKSFLQSFVSLVVAEDVDDEQCWRL